MTAAFIRERGLTSIVHFTTSHGMVGILKAGKLKSTAQLRDDEALAFVYEQNCEYRKDTNWLGHVSLSIEHVNGRFFTWSQKQHLDDVDFWCVLDFDPIIATHDGVYFATTNNIYTGCLRGQGRAGIEALYAPRVEHYLQNGYRHHRLRDAGARPQDPTCPQAEVLYPGAISTEHLRRIFVQDDEHAATIIGTCDAVNHHRVEVVVDAARLRGRA